MEELIRKVIELATIAGGKILLAAAVYIIGSWLIRRLMSILKQLKGKTSLDPTVHSFSLNFIRGFLYVLLIVSTIGILGVPMASIVTALASAGVAIGLALQGALSNLAGGIMLLVFRPFNVGDYISTSSGDGTVAEITMIYTILRTVDNCHITIPNGSLMNAAIKNFSVENTRRVDLKFTCAKGEDPRWVQEILKRVISRNESVLSTPEPFARFSGAANDSMEFTIRVWVKRENYWDVYFDLLQNATEELAREGIKAPAVRVITETNQ